MNKKSRLAILLGILSAGAVCFGFWCSGYDFDVRGKDALGCYLLSLLVGGSLGLLIAFAPTD
jgi:hypothetical protein